MKKNEEEFQRTLDDFRGRNIVPFLLTYPQHRLSEINQMIRHLAEINKIPLIDLERILGDNADFSNPMVPLNTNAHRALSEVMIKALLSAQKQ